MIRVCALIVLLGGPVAAHVGSPDVFFDGKAGPYPVSISIRPPAVIPGIAEVEIRVNAEDIRAVRVVPLPLTGIGANHPPTADLAARSKEDLHYFTASVWLMAFGSYQVRIEVDGPGGTARIAIPVPAVASRIKKMERPIGIALSAMLLLLVAGIVTIAGAAIREGSLEPGQMASPALIRKSRIIMAAATAGLAALIFFGFRWWASDESTYLEHVYKPLTITPKLQAARLNLAVTDPGWFRFRKTDDFIPDHGHLMHLFLVRMPGLDRMYHLHPDAQPEGFGLELPSLPAGHYKLFADVVHANGFPETLVNEVDLPDVTGRALGGDDAAGAAPPLATTERTISPLRDGYRMVWERPVAPLKSRQLTHFIFHVEDAAGNPAGGMQLYMGMPGHAEFISADSLIFAHVHPDGSVPMASLMLTRVPMQHPSGDVSPTVSFPYGFPKAGRYRIFVQMQRAGIPETGIFDVIAVP